MSTRYTAMFVLLYFITVTSAGVLGAYLSNVPLPLDQAVEVTESYEKCLLMKKIFYEGQCWELLSKEPCDKSKCQNIFYSVLDEYV